MTKGMDRGSVIVLLALSVSDVVVVAVIASGHRTRTTKQRPEAKGVAGAGGAASRGADPAL